MTSSFSDNADQRIDHSFRRWQASGDERDELRWLNNRLRVGDLPAERLNYAGILGHVGARLILQHRTALQRPPQRLRYVLGREEDQALLLRWAAACVEEVVPIYESAFGKDSRVSRAVETGFRFADSSASEVEREEADLGACAAFTEAAEFNVSERNRHTEAVHAAHAAWCLTSLDFVGAARLARGAMVESLHSMSGRTERIAAFQEIGEAQALTLARRLIA